MFNSLIISETFFKIVRPHLTPEYFENKTQKLILETIFEFNQEFKKIPSFSDLHLMVDSNTTITESETDAANAYIETIKLVDKDTNEELLIKTIETWCQNRALENAINDSVNILEKNNGDYGLIEQKIKEALGVQFVVKIGTDFFSNAKDRYKSYIEKEDVIPTDIEKLNKLLGGGFRRKSLTVFMGRVNIGKSLILCHLASCLLQQGLNVLYLSAEMSENMIGKRIDSNLMDIPMDELGTSLKKEFYVSKLKEIQNKTKGKLIIKEYPTSSANMNHVRSLLNEIRIKKGYTPDVIILDYLNIFTSTRLSGAASANSYNYVKSIAEEVRALGVEFNAAMVSATQVNRGAFKSSAEELDMTATSESIGLPATVDSLIGINQSEDMFKAGKYLFKNIKSRFDSNINELVGVGVEYSKMRLTNLSGDDDVMLSESEKDKLKFLASREHKELDKEIGFDFG